MYITCEVPIELPYEAPTPQGLMEVYLQFTVHASGEVRLVSGAGGSLDIEFNVHRIYPRTEGYEIQVNCPMNRMDDRQQGIVIDAVIEALVGAFRFRHSQGPDPDLEYELQRDLKLMDGE